MCAYIKTKDRIGFQDIPTGIEFRVIDAYPSYKIVSDGRVWSNKQARWKKPTINQYGYLATSLINKNGNLKNVLVHRLVMEAFCGPSELHVNHINHNRSDPRLENLEYVSCRENITHSKNSPKYRTGTTYHKKSKKWQAATSYKRKPIYIGLFNTQEEAHQAYLETLEQLGEVNRYAG